MNRPIVGSTMGDPAGNGPEITVKALAHGDIYDRCSPIVVMPTMGRFIDKTLHLF